MKNLNRWIIHRQFNSGALPPHGITHFDKPQNPALLLLLLLTAAAATPYVSAQTNQDSSFPDSSYSNFSPSIAVVIVVLFCAFFLIGFFSIYLRQCLDETIGDGNGNSLRSAAVRLQKTPIGLDPELIGSFPVFQYSEVKDLKIGKGSLECAVCITEFEDDETLRLLPKCDHVFHPECIDAWLASHTTCPVCRADLIPNPEDLTVKPGHVTESNQDDQNLSLENQNVNQISISVHEDERVRKLTRSHSTGHSLVQMRENCEKYTLRLPEAVRKQIMSRRLYRTASCVVFPTEGSSRRGYRTGGGDGSSRGRRVGRSDGWGFQFFWRTRSVLSPKAGVDGDVTVVGNSRLFLTSVKTPFDCLALKGDGVDQTSTRPAV